MSQSIIKDPSLAPSGRLKIEWVSKHMPILNQLLKEYSPLQPLTGHTIVTSVHMEAKTAYLVQALAALGAEVHATGCNPLSTQDDVAAALAEIPNVTVYAIHGQNDLYSELLIKALSHCPHIIIDDGGDLVELLHNKYSKYACKLIGGCEETTTGIHRLKALANKKALKFPMFNINDAECKHNYDNHYGTGQSVIDGILRTTNLIIAGKTAVVAGYGDCGSGIAKRLKGLGAKVIVTEVDPIKALKANMDGYTVTKMDQAAKESDIFITATGCKDVITRKHFNSMKSGAILANAGHFDVEIDVASLRKYAVSRSEARHNIEKYELPNGNYLYLIADGRLVNLAAADGHAAEIMDMSFSIQLLSVIHIAKHHFMAKDYDGDFQIWHGKTPPNVYPVPKYIDDKVAKLALESQNITIDSLTKAQHKYLENGF